MADLIIDAFSSQTRLRDMIRAIRGCKTAAEERAVVRKECAVIRASISENDQDYRHRNLAKLMFIHMLGYPTHFGQMECLKSIASAGFPEKRIGYLGLMLLLDERQEVLMLVTNSLKQDLNHSNPYIVGLALCALGNICSAEMARDLAPEVERLFQSRDPNIRKKAALCSVRIIKKVPDLAENFMSPAATLLKEKHHGALIAGVQLCTDMCKVSLEALEYFRKKCTDGLVKALKERVNSPYTPEYDISGISDPFLHIRLLRLLRILGKGDADASDCMNDILAQVATKTETNKNAGTAILYECVETIMSIEDNSGLRVLAINILGRFLSNRDNNIRYVALNMLMRAIAVDAQAVQRHRITILECVKDSDASIRKRALELIFLLVNENNVKPLTKELIDYLQVSDQEFKGDLTEKICSIVEKFSMEKKWYIDKMLKVLSEAGNFVKDEIWHALIVAISNASDLQGYTVRSLYRALQTSSEQESLIQVAVWCIGEYGEMLVNNVGMLEKEDPLTVTESDAVDVLEAAIKRHTSDITSRALSLVALLKLSSRFPSCSKRISDIIIEHKGSFVLELQQRSIEFNSIIDKHQNIRSTLLERMPVLDEASYNSKRKSGSLPPTASAPTGASPKLPNGVVKSPAAPMADLLDLSSDDAPVPSSSGGDNLPDLLGGSLTSLPSLTGQAPSNGTDILMELLSIGTPAAQNDVSTSDLLSTNHNNTPSGTPLERLSPPSPFSPQVSTPTATTPVMDLLDGFSPTLSMSNKKSSTDPYFSGNNGPVYPSIIAFQSSSLKIEFSFSKQPENLQSTLINATFTNMSSNIYTDFIFQAAVPKFIQLHLDPASSNTLPASGNGSIGQSLRVTNSQHGQKHLAMRIRVAYKINNKDVLEQGQITNFPPGL
ncbi:Ap-1 complex subunit gamma-1 [Thalictrum thalictroides]|uniref:AP-1 complex subunit gamma n=1 Tax=Thalictrum thalictroides TaxID=46969 RepID=A0A7J6W306_THATH|nr:Ap-1 complex subunit gamma-1 [Thalictrum thalictroides]